MDKIIQIKKILDIQSEYLILIETYIPFIKGLKNHKKGDLLERPYLLVINRLVKCDLVLILSVLCENKSDYSFTKLKNISSMLPNDKGLNELDKQLVCSKLGESVKIFSELDLKYIRDKYCAHLDKNRDSKDLDLIKIEKLIKLLQDIHTICSNSFFKENVGFDNNKKCLTELLDDNKLLKEFIMETKN